MVLVVKNLPVNARDKRDAGSIPGSGRSPWRRTWQPTSVSCRRIPWTEKPGDLQSVVLHRVRHDWSDLAHIYVCVCVYIYIYIYEETVVSIFVYLLVNKINIHILKGCKYKNANNCCILILDNLNFCLITFLNVWNWFTMNRKYFITNKTHVYI